MASSATTLCLINLSMSGGPLGGQDTFWTLAASDAVIVNGQYVDGLVVYQMSEIEKSRYYSVLVGNADSGSQDALLYLYDNDETGSKTIAFVKWQGQGYHFTADMLYSEYRYTGSHGLYWAQGYQCISEFYPWPWSRIPATIQPYDHVHFGDV
ncbi:hypothetical protein V1517DRAFT_210132 [Lipomyces orientalis]|uniref:Uncharacterized protein n=1 Tax=Lipomyces orientalis TaxID=1233043 RepID=A0ACC3THN1_9ASCO